MTEKVLERMRKVGTGIWAACLYEAAGLLLLQGESKAAAILLAQADEDMGVFCDN